MTPHDEAAAVTRPGLERATAERDALTHAGESVPGTARRRVRTAVVRYLQLELRVAPAERDPRPRRPGVLERVRERLLHEPVGREVDARRELALVAHNLETDGEPCLSDRADQHIE